MESESKFLIERKFAVTLLVILLTAALTYYAKITTSTYENVMVWVSGIFVIGSVTTTAIQYLAMRVGAK